MARCLTPPDRSRREVASGSGPPPQPRRRAYSLLPVPGAPNRKSLRQLALRPAGFRVVSIGPRDSWQKPGDGNRRVGPSAHVVLNVPIPESTLQAISMGLGLAFPLDAPSVLRAVGGGRRRGTPSRTTASSSSGIASVRRAQMSESVPAATLQPSFVLSSTRRTPRPGISGSTRRRPRRRRPMPGPRAQRTRGTSQPAWPSAHDGAGSTRGHKS